MRIEGMRIQFDKETVLKLMDCYPESPVYDEVLQIYEEIQTNLSHLVTPKGLIEFSKAGDILPKGICSTDTDVVMVLFTLGNKMSAYSTALFQKGDYLKGMLVDAMADSCLFTMEKEWKQILKTECQKRNFGIEKRLDAPTDIPMEVQKKIYDRLNGAELGIEISDGYMFFPVKTTCQLFLLTDDVCVDHTEHDCRKCGNIKCKLRSVK